MKLSDEIDPFLGELLTLEALASEPYTSFVYDDAAQAAAIARVFVDARCGEFFPPLGRIVLDDDGSVVGMIAFSEASVLSRARADAAMALVKSGLINDAFEVRDRMLIAGDAMLTCEPGDFYLSRIAVHARGRRKGVGAWMMSQYLAAAADRGARRAVLEVSPAHQAALAMYRNVGFEVIDEKRVSDPDTGRQLAYLHLARLLPGVVL